MDDIDIKTIEDLEEFEKHEILQGFIKTLEDKGFEHIDPEFCAIVQRYFWDLI